MATTAIACDTLAEKKDFVRTIDSRTLIFYLSNVEWLAERENRSPHHVEQDHQWVTAIREELIFRFGSDAPKDPTSQAFEQAAADRGTYPERMEG